MSDEFFGHVPVLATRVRELLAPALQHDGAVYVDATLGAGGHSELILESFPQARVVGLDRDTDAHAIAGARLARFGDRFDAPPPPPKEVLASQPRRDRGAGRPTKRERRETDRLLGRG